MQRYRRSQSFNVHFNQLALFVDDLVESAAEETTEREHDGADGARRGDPETLAGALPADGERPDETGPAGSGSVGGTGDDGRFAVRAGLGEEDGLPGGVGTGNAGVGAGATGGSSGAGKPSVLRAIAIAEVQPEEAPPSRDFRITEAHRIGQGGLSQKARDNIAAIRMLRLVEDESREARDAEKAVLARYSGWGALSNVFHPHPYSEWEEIARALEQNLIMNSGSGY